MPLLIGLLLLLALIPFAFLRGSHVPEAEAAWWNPSWQHRKRIDVTNPNATDLNDFQVSFILDTAALISAGKLQAECQDIRITDIGGRELPFWIEENNPGCNNANTKIWVKMPGLPQSGGTLYAYYGNASAAVSSDHDGEQVFEYFDDMEDWESWTTYSNGQVSQDDVRVFSGTYSAHKTTEGDPHGAYKDIGQTLGRNVVLEFMVNRNSGYTGGDVDRVGLIDNSGNGYGWFYSNAGNTIGKDKRTSYTASYTTSSADSGYMDTWVKAQLIISSDNTITARRFSGDLLIGEHSSADSSYSSFTRLYIFGGYDYWVDQVTIRKYASAEPTTSTQTEEIGPGPVAYWKFDEGSGGTVFDSAGDNEGTISGALWQTNCATGNCLTFDGINDYVSRVDQGTTDPLRLNGAANLTLESWINVDNLSASNELFIISKYDYSVQQGYSLQVKPNGGFRFDINGSANAKTTSGGYVSEHTWHHVAAVFKDGNTMQIFVDGNLKETFSIASTTLIGSSRPLAMGTPSNSLGSDTFSFSGAIDEPKIFPYALTEDQIKTEYNLGAAAVMGTGPTIAPPADGTLSDSLVAHWAFDEQYGQTAHDKIGNNHGTFGASTSPGSDDPTWTAAGECKVNGCLGFDGGDHVDAGNSASLNIQNLFTATAWIKTTSTQSTIISKKDTSPYPGYSIRVSTTGLIAVHLAGADQWKSGTTIVNDGRWHHVAWTYDGITSTIFVDGKLDATHAMSTTTTPSTNFYIGKTAFDATNFNGLMDEVKLYNTALTPDQAKQDMNAGASVAYSVGSEEADELADGAGAPPIAEWKFDEKQGTVAYDSSGNANDGTVNGATWKSGCQQGACLEFDGVDNYVQIPNSASLYTPNNNQWTMQAWVYSTDTSGIRVILRKNSSGGAYFIRMVNGAFQSLFNFTDGYSQEEGGTIQPNQWQHVAATYDGTTRRHYINGQLIAQWAENRTLNFETSTYVAVGRNSTSPTEYWQGQLDHVRIYNYARTPAQIAYDYNRGAPIAHWKFDECEGTVAHDASGNENHGTINIGATGTQTTAGTCSTSGAWANGASGKFEASLNFDGTDDYVDLGTGFANFQDTTPFSLSSWIKTTDTGAAIISKWNVPNQPGWRQDISSGYFRLILTSANGSAGRAARANTQFNDDSWHHLVTTYDGSSSASGIKIYVDGRQVSTSIILNSNPGTLADSSVRIGNQEGIGNPFLGQIDDVRIYNYALSPSQVQKVHNQGYGVRYGSN